ncbi:MAG TPA: serine/threonine-protein kinase PknK, partial [Myxococcota bacterium]|nr:serine/threonine-protein kinase PknK [Myxococcota bacterium]
SVAASARHNRGLALFRLGRLEEACAVESAAVESLAAQGGRRLAGGSRMYLASILLAAGQAERAEQEARAASQVLADVPTLRPYALGVLAQVLLATGRSAEALAACGEALSAINAGEAVEAGEPLVRLVHAEALRAAGQPAAARDALTAAAAQLQARAARLADPATRRAFLEQIPEHARTLALARSGDETPEAP